MAVTDLLEENEAASESIGAILRNAREAAGYSIADVAERMRLSRHHIENLEAERFDLFPVSVFLRGYLTSYARLVGVDAEPLLEAYDRRGFGPPQLHSQDTARTAPRGSEFTVTVTTLVVIAVLIVLSVLWWREQWTDDAGLPIATVEHPDDEPPPLDSDEGPGEPAGPRGPTGETALVEPLNPETAADAPGVEPPPVPVDTGPDEGDARPDSIEPAEAAPAPTADAAAPEETSPAGRAGTEEPAATAPAAAGADAEAAAAGAPDLRSEPVPAPVDTVTPAPAPAPAPADDAEPPAGDATGELASLVIRVREDCWLMIRDAEQRLLYRNLAAAGTVLDLTATPPIRIVAGYAEGIDVEYNGEPFDLAPHVEQDTGTARFQLGS